MDCGTLGPAHGWEELKLPGLIRLLGNLPSLSAADLRAQSLRRI